MKIAHLEKQARLAKDLRADFWEIFAWDLDRVATEFRQLKLIAPKHLKAALDNLEADLEGFQSMSSDRREAAEAGLRIGLRWMAILEDRKRPRKSEHPVCEFIRREQQGSAGTKASAIISDAIEKLKASGYKGPIPSEESLRKSFSKILNKSPFA